MLPITSKSAAFSRPATVQGSVRAPVPYQGSMDANDLLDLYVGNTHYRKINRYMRAPDHQSGVNEILDEMITRDGKLYSPKLHEEANQVVASIPHLEKALALKPPTAPGQIKQDYRDVAEHFFKDPTGDLIWEATAENPMMIQGKVVDPEHFAVVAGDFEGLLEKHLMDTKGVKLWQQNGTVHPEALNAANDFLDGKIQLENPSTEAGNLYRGVHFKNPAEYDAFVNQHKPGAVVEYPAFTSTTSDTRIQEGFANKRHGEYPVLMEIENPTQGRWVDNAAESEYLYPGRSRFEVVRSEPIATGNSNDDIVDINGNAIDLPFLDSSPSKGLPGTKLIVRETTAPTPVQARTQGLMGRLQGKGKATANNTGWSPALDDLESQINAELAELDGLPMHSAPEPSPSARPRIADRVGASSAYSHLMTRKPTQPVPQGYRSYDSGERYAMW